MGEKARGHTYRLGTKIQTASPLDSLSTDTLEILQHHFQGRLCLLYQKLPIEGVLCFSTHHHWGVKVLLFIIYS